LESPVKATKIMEDDLKIMGDNLEMMEDDLEFMEDDQKCKKGWKEKHMKQVAIWCNLKLTNIGI
jgi:hypothetical protein